MIYWDFNDMIYVNLMVGGEERVVIKFRISSIGISVSIFSGSSNVVFCSCIYREL